MKSIVVALLTTTVLLTCACSSSGPQSSAPATNLKQLEQKRSGDYTITLSNESGSLKQGANNLTLEFRKADQLADPGSVEVKPMMEMKGMGPMLANTKANPSGTPGRYNVTTDLSMAGPWKIMVTYSGGETEFNLVTQ